jgi:hypothetical protein
MMRMRCIVEQIFLNFQALIKSTLQLTVICEQLNRSRKVFFNFIKALRILVCGSHQLVWPAELQVRLNGLGVQRTF